MYLLCACLVKEADDKNGDPEETLRLPQETTQHTTKSGDG